jgi:RNA polymerase sigma-B factor
VDVAVGAGGAGGDGGDEATFAIWRVDGTDVVRVRGALDLPAAVRLRLALFGRLDAGAARIVVDLAGVRLLDAGSINVLVQVAERSAERGGGLLVRGARGTVLRVLEIAGVATRFGAYEPLEPRLADRGADAGDSADVAVHGLWGDEINALVERLHRLPADDPGRRRVRDEAVRMCLPHAERLARRFYGLGEQLCDLNQVAALGLLKAVDRYDPAQGSDFASFALPTITGELKRHFRDRGWMVRVSRRLQELRLDVRRARVELTQELGREPTTADIAGRLDVDEAEVGRALAASVAYQPASLDAPVLGAEHPLGDTLGRDEDGYAAIDDQESLRPLLAALPAREREIVILKFFGNQTQSEIADRIGVSQMHVSRLLSRTLAGLRTSLLASG